VTFDSFVFGGKPQLTEAAVQVFEKEPMFNAIHGLKASIGMATVSQPALADPSVRFIAVDGVAATAETIKSGSYPIRRPLYITYRTAGLKPGVQAFLDYVRGPEGQRLTASL
jgi:phosphate transport system substrate-binding protein